MAHSQMCSRRAGSILMTVVMGAVGFFLAGCQWWQHRGDTPTQYYDIVVPVAKLYSTPPLNPTTTYLGVQWMAPTGLPVNVCMQAANNPFSSTSPFTVQPGAPVKTNFRPNVTGTFYFTTTAGSMCPTPDPIDSTPHIIIVKNE